MNPKKTALQELSGMPPERTPDGQVIPKPRTRWYVLLDEDRGLYWAVNEVTGYEGFWSREYSEPITIYFNSRQLALQHGKAKMKKKAVPLSDAQMTEVGLV